MDSTPDLRDPRHAALLQALDMLADGIALFDRAGQLQHANRAYGDLLGLSQASLIPGAHLAELIPHAWPSRLPSEPSEAAHATFTQNREGQSLRVVERRTPDGGCICQVSLADDARTQFLAYHDPLTELPNRALFEERLPQTLARARRNGTMVALHFVDLDRFKHVNDSMGHPAGDVLLREVAARLRGCLRESDIVVRLGGDEFAILQSDLTRVDGAASLARKVQTALAEPIQLRGQEVQVGASVGVAVYPLDSNAPAELLRAADLAMYHAKRSGGAVRFFTPALDEEMQARAILERDLHDALARGEFALFFQPQFELKTGRLTGMEALLRWHHPRRGLLLPGDFLRLAEESVLVQPLTRWVLGQACAQARRWQTAGLGEVRLTVNVPAASLQRGYLVGLVDETLAATRMEPRLLELDIPEHALTRAPEVADAVRKLRERRLTLAVDDFGTGTSSLLFLRSLQVHRLKIDRSLVSGQPADRDSTLVARAITDLAHRLEMRVTAEGIETAEQLSRLRDDGCDEGHGFCLGPPLPAEECTALFRRH